ncbi:MAG TPA: LemA family protein, partial [Pirellulales bacterium]|nr:LemA family protein [Pirellulales bacterium]
MDSICTQTHGPEMKNHKPQASSLKSLLPLLAALVALSASGCGYNYVVGLDEKVNGAWAEVDNQLKRRNDLVPELVNTVKGVAGQEQTVFLGIEEARKSFFSAQTVPEKQEAGRQMDGALSRLLLLQETYPELKSNEQFLKLHDSLEGTENRLAVARERYNEAVRELNEYVRQLPGRFWASLAGVEKHTYYEIDKGDRAAPNVDFSGLNPRLKEKEGEKAEGKPVEK